jgi:hypothetical protein
MRKSQPYYVNARAERNAGIIAPALNIFDRSAHLRAGVSSLHAGAPDVQVKLRHGRA